MPIFLQIYLQPAVLCCNL